MLLIIDKGLKSEVRVSENWLNLNKKEPYEVIRRCHIKAIDSLEYLIDKCVKKGIHQIYVIENDINADFLREYSDFIEPEITTTELDENVTQINFSQHSNVVPFKRKV